MLVTLLVAVLVSLAPIAAADDAATRKANVAALEARQPRPAGDGPIAAYAPTTITAGCLPTALPGSPTTPIATYSGSSYGDGYTASVWREKCLDNAARSAVLVRITPASTATPFICSSGGFQATQNGVQYDSVRLLSTGAGNTSFCAYVTIPITLAIDQWSFDDKFDDQAAFTLVDTATNGSFKYVNVVTTSGVSLSPLPGVWWSEAEPGRGFNLEVQNGSLFFLMYGYQGSGPAVWYLASGAMSGTTFTGPLTEYSGGQTLSGSWRQASSSGSVGTVTIQVAAENQVLVTLPSGRALTLTKFTSF